MPQVPSKRWITFSMTNGTFLYINDILIYSDDEHSYSGYLDSSQVNMNLKFQSVCLVLENFISWGTIFTNMELNSALETQRPE